MGAMARIAGATTNVVRDASKTGGGMASVALPLHDALLDRHLDAHIICGLLPEREVRKLHVAGPTGDGFRKLSKESMSGLVHIHGLWTPFTWRAHRRARRSGARLIVSPHGSLEPWAFKNKRTKKLAAWWLYQRNILERAELVVVNSDRERDQLRRLGLTSPVAVIAHGVDVRARPEDMLGSPRRDRERVVLFFARLSPKKGIPDLLQAWHSLKDRRGYELHIHGYGEATYLNFVKGLIDELGLGRHVKLLGGLFGAEKWRKFQASSIYVLPSYSENFGITVAEALMSGLPVITTRATPWTQLATKRLGWIVDNDVDQLSLALTEALALNPDQLGTIGERAKCYARQNFSWPQIADQYVTTYEWVRNPALPKPDWISLGR